MNLLRGTHSKLSHAERKRATCRFDNGNTLLMRFSNKRIIPC